MCVFIKVIHRTCQGSSSFFGLWKFEWCVTVGILYKLRYYHGLLTTWDCLSSRSSGLGSLLVVDNRGRWSLVHSVCLFVRIKRARRSVWEATQVKWGKLIGQGLEFVLKGCVEWQKKEGGCCGCGGKVLWFWETQGGDTHWSTQGCSRKEHKSFGVGTFDWLMWLHKVKFRKLSAWAESEQSKQAVTQNRTKEIIKKGTANTLQILFPEVKI